MKIKDVLSEIGGVSYSGGGTAKKPTPMDAGEFSGTPIAKARRAPLPNTPPPGTAVAAKGPNTPPPGTAVAVKLPNTPPPGTAVAKPKVAKSGADARHAGRTDVGSTSTVSGSARNKQAQAKFNQRQPSSVAKTTKKPTGTVGGDLSDKTLNDRK